MFYFDVQLRVPKFCKQVMISVFGNIDSSNIISVSVEGAISVEFIGQAVPITVRHVISTQTDKMANGSEYPFQI